MTATREIQLGQDQPLLESTLAALKECSYFHTMRDGVLRDVLNTGAYLEVPRGELLIREGGADDDIFFLLEGTVGIYSGGKPVLTLGQPGDIIGEFAVVSSAPRSADVKA
jgi:CRP-like cAMP-binding protein